MAFFRYSLKLLILIFFVFSYAVSGWAQSFPAKPVRLIVTGSPGSSGDTLGRLVSEGLSQIFGRQVILDNRPGAGANIGPEIASKSPPDGYTLFMVTISHAVNATLYKQLAYDLMRDFAPVTQLITDPAALVVNSAVAAKSVDELIKLAKARPGSLNYSSGGTGTFTFLAAELFKGQAGVDFVHVPYKGGGPALVAVVAGEVSVYFAPLGVSLPYIRQGRLRPLAVTTLKRLPLVPELPTVAESGLPGFEAGNWFGLLVPAKTPKATIAMVHDAAVSWLHSPGVNKLFNELAYVAIGNSPAVFSTFIKSEIARLGKVVRALNLTAE